MWLFRRGPTIKLWNICFLLQTKNGFALIAKPFLFMDPFYTKYVLHNYSYHSFTFTDMVVDIDGITEA